MQLDTSWPEARPPVFSFTLKIHLWLLWNERIPCEKPSRPDDERNQACGRRTTPVWVADTLGR